MCPPQKQAEQRGGQLQVAHMEQEVLNHGAARAQRMHGGCTAVRDGVMEAEMQVSSPQ